MGVERLVVTSTKPETGNQKFSVVTEIPSTFRGSRIVFATSEEGRSVVIKIPAVIQGAEREWIGLTKNSESEIPVPTPLMLGITDSGKNCIVMERVYGKPLFLYPSDESRTEFGRIVKQMHTNVRINGFEWQESSKVDYLYYDKLVEIWVNEINQIGINISHTQSLFHSLSFPMNDYCVATKPVFNHNDIHDGQLIKPNKNEGTLIDFEEWTEDRPLNDIGYYLFHCLRTDNGFENFKAFMNGYLDNKPLNETEKQALIYNLLFISTRAVIKFSNFKVNYLETAKETHLKVLKFIEDELLWKEL